MLLEDNSNEVILCCPDEHLGLGCMRGDAGSPSGIMASVIHYNGKTEVNIVQLVHIYVCTVK